MHSRTLITPLVGFLVLMLGSDALLHAQSPARRKSTVPSASNKESNKPKPPVVTPEREAAVMTFVRRNHEDLAQLLVHLKENQPREYERAIRELFRTSERLAQVQERDPQQYDLELQLWNVQSRIQLMAARAKMGASGELTEQLEELLGKELDLRAELLRHDRKRVAERLARIDGDLDRMKNQRDEIVRKRLRVLTAASQEGSGSGNKATNDGAPKDRTRRANKENKPRD